MLSQDRNSVAVDKFIELLTRVFYLDYQPNRSAFQNFIPFSKHFPPIIYFINNEYKKVSTYSHFIILILIE